MTPSREQVQGVITRHCERAQWAIHKMTVGVDIDNPWEKWLVWWKERDAYLRSFLPKDAKP
jgi:hypothetical protein